MAPGYSGSGIPRLGGKFDRLSEDSKRSARDHARKMRV